MSVYHKVVTVISESLAVEPDEVRPDANLLRDLGAESIDLLDLVFRLENEFSLDIPRGELFPDFLFRATSDFVADGRLTDAGRKQVSEAFPFIDDAAVAGVGEPRDLFTVDLLAAYVDWKVTQSG